MTNLDAEPAESLSQPAGWCGPRLELFEAREVPLGGIRAITVRRTLPQRHLPTVGAWCFLDQFGPDEGPPMRVLPHPHTGLQTVTWPIRGQIRHRDSLGNDLLVKPGQLNLMTAGRGIAHSEFSEEGEGIFGLQFWAALPGSLPGADEDGGSAFQQVTDLPVLRGSGVELTVFTGSLALADDGGTGPVATSPAVVHTELIGADGSLAPGSMARIALDPRHEHAVLVVEGAVEIDGQHIAPGPLAYLGAGRQEIRISAASGEAAGGIRGDASGGDGPQGDDTATLDGSGARFVLLGGEPFTEDLVMFWNFVGRDHDEVARARADWEEQAGTAAEVLGEGNSWMEPGAQLRFGLVPGHGEDRIPAPQLPPVRLTPRRRR